MKDMIAERWVRWQFRLHLIGCALLVGVPFLPQLGIASGSVLAASAVLLWGNLRQRFGSLPVTAVGFRTPALRGLLAVATDRLGEHFSWLENKEK